LNVRPLTLDDAEAVAGWRYEGPYSTYDVDAIVTPEDGYWAVEEGGELVGYCCNGESARVPGFEEAEGVLDVGYSLRPDLVGRGRGPELISTVLDHAAREFAPRTVRILVLRWNERSRRAAEKVGFRVVGEHGEFDVLTREA